MYGKVESRKMEIGRESNDSVNPVEFLDKIDCKLTNRLRDWSGAREKETSL